MATMGIMRFLLIMCCHTTELGRGTFKGSEAGAILRIFFRALHAFLERFVIGRRLLWVSLSACGLAGDWHVSESCSDLANAGSFCSTTMSAWANGF